MFNSVKRLNKPGDLDISMYFRFWTYVVVNCQSLSKIGGIFTLYFQLEGDAAEELKLDKVVKWGVQGAIGVPVILGRAAISPRDQRCSSQTMALNPAASAMDVGTPSTQCPSHTTVQSDIFVKAFGLSAADCKIEKARKPKSRSMAAEANDDSLTARRLNDVNGFAGATKSSWHG